MRWNLTGYFGARVGVSDFSIYEVRTYSFLDSHIQIRFPMEMCVCVCVCVCVFVCVCVCVYILPPWRLLPSARCPDILEYTDQRSCVVNINPGASAKFLHLGIWKCHISPPKTKTPATTNWIENDMIYWRPVKKW